jgi:subtilisin-like proprotein convertase family protein
MNKSIVLLSAIAACALSARANTFTYNISSVIPDGDLNGIQNSQSIGGMQPYMSDVNVTLNISGGFNGDLYAFLTHNGKTAILLNRVGRSGSSSVGYSDAGFGPDGSSSAFTLDDQAGHDVHSYRTVSYTLNGSGQLTGSWQPDARNIDPLSPGSAFDSANRFGTLSQFNGFDPNGTWTLFIADTSSGAESTIVSWGLQITAAPEPGIACLMLAGGALLSFRRRAICDRV